MVVTYISTDIFYHYLSGDLPSVSEFLSKRRIALNDFSRIWANGGYTQVLFKRGPSKL